MSGRRTSPANCHVPSTLAGRSRRGHAIGAPEAYARQAEIDHTSDIKPEDLEISKEGNQIVISFAYDKRIPLFGPVSLLIDFEGSTAK